MCLHGEYMEVAFGTAAWLSFCAWRKISRLFFSGLEEGWRTSSTPTYMRENRDTAKHGCMRKGHPLRDGCGCSQPVKLPMSTTVARQGKPAVTDLGQERRQVVHQMPAQVGNEAPGRALGEETRELLVEARGLDDDVLAFDAHVLDAHPGEEHGEVDVGVPGDELLLRDVDEGLLQAHVWLELLVHGQLGLDLDTLVGVAVGLLFGAPRKRQLRNDELAVGGAVRLHLVRVVCVVGLVRQDQASGAQVEVHELRLEVVGTDPPVEEGRHVPELKLRHDDPEVLVRLDGLDLA